MKIKQQILIILITLFCTAHADTLTVKQDSTGDYLLIQEAINNSQNNDIVLVYPGTYYENVDFYGKSITLASLVLTTGDISYKYSTIIDGNQFGSCVRLVSGESATINGFTLQNGTGSSVYNEDTKYGGGVLINESECVILNCVIKSNFAHKAGGGIAVLFDASILLSGVSILNNHAYYIGGGLLIGYQGNAIFDSVNICNIYNNFSMLGCDIHKYTPNQPVSIFLDTCTVLNPDWYFFSSIDDHGYQQDDFIISIQNGWLDPVDNDLYVNPASGSDTNSGLSPSEPLKTIAFAYSLIMPDSINKNTIHLADGVYSDSTNNEKFPLNIRGYIDVVGQSMNNTILDGEYKSMLMKGNNEVSNYSFRKMTMQRGGDVLDESDSRLVKIYVDNYNTLFDSIVFRKGHQWFASSAVEYTVSGKCIISNSKFIYNMGGQPLRTMSQLDDTLIIENCVFMDNMPDYQQSSLMGRAIIIHGGHNSVNNIVGCLFANNNNYSVSAHGTSDSLQVSFVNCTFSDNAHLSGYKSLSFVDADVNMYNCVVYNEGNTVPIYHGWNYTEHNRYLNIYNSLIENGTESIETESPYGILYYDDTNIEGDPLFYYGPDFPYNLSDNSPCIDAGTLDLPEWIELPETDLAGNPRIYGDKIDMGAYEWNPTVDYPEFQEIKNTLLFASPNPFTDETTIKVVQTNKGHVKVEVYSFNGLRVKLLLDRISAPGTSNIVWRGDDDKGNLLPAGTYVVTLTYNNKEVESIKVIKM